MGNVPKPFVLLEEVLRLFNDNPDFYFCFGRDITHCTQKLVVWRHFSFNNTDPDERFYWNKLLLKDLLEETTDKNLAKKWSLFILLTEPRLKSNAIVLRIVPVRGSVPIFWSQKGFKYRPPLSIDRSLEESMPYFTTHMQMLISHYGSPLVAVNLVDQAGRELELAKSFVEVNIQKLGPVLFYSGSVSVKFLNSFKHAARFNSPDLHFVSFDLHRHCRGLKFDKIGDIISRMEDLLREIGYCWVDKTGEVVKTQKGVVRTNCVDCLDRTNLVQYAGTAALKGDVTRSGERRLTGIMKD
ncbi:unnamed protein product, partial [Strongylus vulgaris]